MPQFAALEITPAQSLRGAPASASSLLPLQKASHAGWPMQFAAARAEIDGSGREMAGPDDQRGASSDSEDAGALADESALETPSRDDLPRALSPGFGSVVPRGRESGGQVSAGASGGGLGSLQATARPNRTGGRLADNLLQRINIGSTVSRTGQPEASAPTGDKKARDSAATHEDAALSPAMQPGTGAFQKPELLSAFLAVPAAASPVPDRAAAGDGATAGRHAHVPAGATALLNPLVVTVVGPARIEDSTRSDFARGANTGGAIATHAASSAAARPDGTVSSFNEKAAGSPEQTRTAEDGFARPDGQQDLRAAGGFTSDPLASGATESSATMQAANRLSALHPRDAAQQLTAASGSAASGAPAPAQNAPLASERTQAQEDRSVAPASPQRRESLSPGAAGRIEGVLLTHASGAATGEPIPVRAPIEGFGKMPQPFPGNSVVSDSHAGSGDAFVALDDTSAGLAPIWAHASAHRAEAGFVDPTLGWIGVRAETSAGSVHASLMPGSAEAATALSSHLAGLNAYLAQHHTEIAPVSVDVRGERGIDAGVADHGGHQAPQGEQSETRQSGGAAHADRTSRDGPCDDHVRTGSPIEIPAMPAGSGTGNHVSLIA